MHPAIVRRAIAAVAAITLLTVPSVLAETVDTDGDLLTSGFQNSFDLGTVQPGADVARDIFFVLTCTGTSHVDTGQNIRLSLGPRVVPPGGTFSVGSLLFGRGAGWPVDGQECPAGIQPAIGGPLHIILTAPTTPGQYRFMFSWTRSLTNPNPSDGTVFTGTNPSVEFFMTVPGGPANTLPRLNLPADSTIDGNTTGGAIAAYVVTASDDEDAVPPTPSCTPAVGQVLPIGPNTISCTVSDTGGLTATGSFTITVRNTPPTLHLPASSTVEGNTTGGATAAYVVTASDIEDAVAPTPSCSPAVGAHLNLGPNTITCTATDGNGLPTPGSFVITVRDTTAPTLAGMPGDVSLTTTDPTGTTLTYASPTASDIVDAAPSVNCSPASGDKIPLGDTTVTCTARDASGNTSSASFVAHVTRALVGGATWEDPVGASAGIVVNGSRTIPVKARLTLDGQPITGGAGMLTVVSCDGGAPVDTEPLAVQSNGRWMGHLSTDGLAAGCYRVTASVDGQAIGSFQLDVGGAAPAAKPAKGPVPAASAVADKAPKPDKPLKPAKP